MKVRATDIHGYYTDAMISIKIDDYRPIRRSDIFEKIYQDIIEVEENKEFDFILPDTLFYDQQNS